MPGSISVGNRHHGHEGIYVGRGSALGNPYIIGTDGNRSEVLWRFAEYLERHARCEGAFRDALADLYRRYHSGEALVLVCFCHPKPCHADLIRQFIIRQRAPARSPLR